MKSYRSDQDPPALETPGVFLEEKLSLENELIHSKSTMYKTLSVFIGTQSIVSILVAVLLAFLITSIIIFVLFWATMNEELLNIIANYYLTKIMEFIQSVFSF